MVKKYVIKGLVQGIGYRPFVAEIADKLNIDGFVRNTGGIVTVVARGQESALISFRDRITNDLPTGGFITSVVEEEANDGEVALLADSGFVIVNSDQDLGANLPLIPADIATCPDCQKELFDPANRRYLHPFISCTVCGPRYSILKSLPYDRETITMGDFEMCPDCQKEYSGRGEKRRHAQTIACKACGPQLEFRVISSDSSLGSNEINDAIAFLKAGGILAIKDIGGYHLACNPFDRQAVAALRILKHREAKSFAIMFEDLDQIREYATVNEKEGEALESPARPIVLVRRIQNVDKDFADNVCLSSPDVGAMLPCNPVQIMLVKECGPLIMTSGNASGDVLETDNDKMTEWMKERGNSPEMKGVSLAILSHNREILRPMDDSVMKIVRGRSQYIRRGRGHVPTPIPVDIPGEIFAAGGDLKSTFCYIKNGLAYPSQYLGDLESVSCQEFYQVERDAMSRIFGFEPKAVVRDKHPGYFSNQVAAKGNLPIIDVQHHKAHVASVIAEQNIKGPILGFAFDGTGYGDDGAIWGSEIFAWDGHSMERVGHLKEMKLIGGDQGAKNTNTIALAMIHNLGLDEKFDSLAFKKGLIHDFDKGGADLIRAAIDNGINTINSTSMGRLFDAVSAILGICHYNSYEGQAPIELENIASQTKEAYPLKISKDGDTKELFAALLNAMEEGVDVPRLARGFILGVADFIKTKADEMEINQIVLSGGTFLNRILLETSIDLLEDRGYKVYTAQILPPGDGGICLGQAYIVSKNN